MAQAVPAMGGNPQTAIAFSVPQQSLPSSAPPTLSSPHPHNPSSSPGTVPSPDLVAARVKLLAALGLTPEYLVSTGLLDRPTLLSLLGVGYGIVSFTCVVGYLKTHIISHDIFLSKSVITMIYTFQHRL